MPGRQDDYWLIGKASQPVICTAVWCLLKLEWPYILVCSVLDKLSLVVIVWKNVNHLHSNLYDQPSHGWI